VDTFPVIKPTVSKHWQKFKEQMPTIEHPLDLTFPWSIIQ